MDNENLHYRHINLFYFKKGKNASKTCNKLCSVYGKDAVTTRIGRKWFEQFWSGNVCVQESPRSGRPTKIDKDKIKVLVDENPYSTTRNIAGELQISHPTILKHIHKIGYFSRLNAWVPHALTEAQMARRTEICFFEDAEKIEGARLGCFSASTIFPRSSSFRLSPTWKQ